MSSRDARGTGSAIDAPKLRMWIKRQQRDYARWRKGEPTFLSDDGFRLLTKMGFEWVDKETIPLVECSSSTQQGKSLKRAHSAVGKLEESTLKRKPATLSKYNSQPTDPNDLITSSDRKDPGNTHVKLCGSDLMKSDSPPTKVAFGDQKEKRLTEHPPRNANEEKSWESFYDELKLLIASGSDISSEVNRPLRDWAIQQFDEYENHMYSRPTKLSLREFELLQKINFEHSTVISDADIAEWNENYGNLLQFLTNHDSLMNARPESKLGIWVATLRNHFGYYINGTGGCLTKERVNLLRDINFDFSVPRQRKQPERFVANPGIKKKSKESRDKDLKNTWTTRKHHCIEKSVNDDVNEDSYVDEGCDRDSEQGFSVQRQGKQPERFVANPGHIKGTKKSRDKDTIWTTRNRHSIKNNVDDDIPVESYVDEGCVREKKKRELELEHKSLEISIAQELDDDIDEETYERLINAMEPQVAGPGVPAVLAKSNKMWQGRFEELVQFRKQFKHAHTSVYLNNGLHCWLNRMKKMDEEGKLTTNRLERLKALGCKWTSDLSDV